MSATTTAAIHLSNSDHSNVTGNTIHDVQHHGLWVDDSDYNNVSGNTVYNVPNYGITVDNSSSYNSVSGNEVHDCKYGLLIRHGASYNQITDNTIYSNDLYGIMFEDVGTTGNDVIGNTCDGSGPTGPQLCGMCISAGTTAPNIRDNDVYGHQYGIALCEQADDVTVWGNSVHDNDNGIWVHTDYTGVNASIHYNNIVGNGLGFANVSVAASIVDAECNWWGDASGPSDGEGVTDPVTGTPAIGSGDKVSANVRFDPWLNAPYPKGKPVTLARMVGVTAKGGTIEWINPDPDNPDAKITGFTNPRIGFTSHVLVKDGKVKGKATLRATAKTGDGQRIVMIVRMDVEEIIELSESRVYVNGPGKATIIISNAHKRHARAKVIRKDLASVRFDVVGGKGGYVNVAGGTSYMADDVFRVSGMDVRRFHFKTHVVPSRMR